MKPSDPASVPVEIRLARLESELARKTELLRTTQEQLLQIYTSPEWKILHRVCRVRDRLLPPEAAVRRTLEGVFRTSLQASRWLLTPITRRPPASINDEYPFWIRRHEPGPAELARQRTVEMPRGPRISLLLPLADARADTLRSLLESVRAQTYPSWELCVAGAFHQPPAVERVLRDAADDPRVLVRKLTCEPSAAVCLSAALAGATGTFVLPLGPHDRLPPFALFALAETVDRQPDIDFLYADEDRLDARGRRRDPLFKPDWSPDTLRGHDYVGRPTLIRKSLVETAGGFRPGFEGAETYDLTLRCTEQARRIEHLPQVLYHARRRRHDDRHAESDTAAERHALAEHLARAGCLAEVKPGLRPRTHQVCYAVPRRPGLAVIIPNRDHPELLTRCVRSVRDTGYRPLEILIVENQSTRPETFACYESLKKSDGVRVLTWDGPFNYAAVNNLGAARTDGELLLFLNNDIESRRDDWIDRLVEHAVRPEVGVVGAKLYYPDGTIQHGGIILGLHQWAGHAHLGRPGDSAGYHHRLVVTQNLSAVTGACLMIRHAVFDEVGGFDEEYELAFNDIDLCLRVGERGYRVVWTPHAELTHHEAKTRGRDRSRIQKIRFIRETQTFQVQWRERLRRCDPFYNPNLSRSREDFGLNLAEGAKQPWSVA